MQNILSLSIAVAFSFCTIVFWSWEAAVQTHAIKLLNDTIMSSYCF